jgi:hypothetical protein
MLFSELVSWKETTLKNGDDYAQVPSKKKIKFKKQLFSKRLQVKKGANLAFRITCNLEMHFKCASEQVLYVERDFYDPQKFCTSRICVRPITFFEVGYYNYFTEMATIL